MKEKIDLLNKNIKELENQINNRTIEQNNQKSNNNTHNNQDEVIDYKNFNYSLSQQNFKTFNIRNVKNIYNKNNSYVNNNNISNRSIIFSKNLDNNKNTEKNDEKIINEDNGEIEQEESSSSYILKYVRKSNK